MVAYLLLGCVVLFCIYILVNWFIQTDAHDVLRVLKWLAAFGVLLFIIGLLISGKLGWALAALPALFVWVGRFRNLFGFGKAARDWSRAGQNQQNKRPSSADMSREEALAVLGLEEGASKEDIKAAHHRLIAQLHPDKGGSQYLAVKINQAKDILLDE